MTHQDADVNAKAPFPPPKTVLLTAAGQLLGHSRDSCEVARIAAGIQFWASAGAMAPSLD